MAFYRRSPPPNLGPFISWYSDPEPPPTYAERLVRWFEFRDGRIDTSAIDFVDIPGQGRGAVALKDIPEGHTLFTIPRSLVLSTRTSTLRSRFGEERWREHQLDKGWVGLILCMLWEKHRLSENWAGYIGSLPMTFDTPIFWNDADLEELKGSSVLEKIGKEDAERDFYEKLLPAVQSHPSLFRDYSIEEYHTMGSLILSRSFSLEESESNDGKSTSRSAEMDTSESTAMDVDEDSMRTEDDKMDLGDDDDDDDSSYVAMIPMADMLNARYGSNNAKLFHEELELKMITTKPIKAGEQIFNTYGDLPNSELLRRYGHVDLLPLPEGLGEGNPADVVEIRADLVVNVVSRALQEQGELHKERIDWWLEEGGDDIFVLELDMELPDPFLSLIRLLILPSDEWTRARAKGKLPKAETDDAVLKIAQDVLENRLSLYATSMTEDENLLQNSDSLSLNKRHAIIVRLGEKRILNGILNKVQMRLEHENRASKRKADGSGLEHRGSQVPIPKKHRK